MNKFYVTLNTAWLFIINYSFFCTFPSDDIDIKKVPDLLRD